MGRLDDDIQKLIRALNDVETAVKNETEVIQDQTDASKKLTCALIVLNVLAVILTAVIAARALTDFGFP